MVSGPESGGLSGGRDEEPPRPPKGALHSRTHRTVAFRGSGLYASGQSRIQKENFGCKLSHPFRRSTRVPG